MGIALPQFLLNIDGASSGILLLWIVGVCILLPLVIAVVYLSRSSKYTGNYVMHQTLSAYYYFMKPSLAPRMVQSLRSEAKKSEDIFMQLQEIQESARLAFLNCLLDFAGHLERIGGELAHSKSNKESPHFQNGYSLDPLQQPESVIHPLQQLLMVLSNIGYCKDELSRELYNRYKHIWLHSRSD